MNVAIIDDEPLARARIKRLLEKHEDMNLIADASNGREGLNVINSHHPDLIFLDIGMPDMDGFQVVNSFDEPNKPYVIFSTAFPQHAVKAFEIDAVDYLLKPYNKTRFDCSLEKARKHFNFHHSESNQPQPMQDEYIHELVICERGREDRVKLENVTYIQAFGNYIRLVVEDKTFLYRVTMSQIESKLNPDTFMRIHRSYIINKEFVDNISYLSKNEYAVRLSEGTEITSGRKYMPTIKEHLSRTF